MGICTFQHIFSITSAVSTTVHRTENGIICSILTVNKNPRCSSVSKEEQTLRGRKYLDTFVFVLFNTLPVHISTHNVSK